jgi:uncharacterized protein YdeI (BOF family)
MKRGGYKFFLGFFGLMLLGLFLSLSINKTQAADHLVINEIYPNQIYGGADSEWAELFDQTNSISDLSNYSLIKITGSGTEYKKPLSSTVCQKNDNYFVCDLGVNWLANNGATLVLRNGSLEIDKVVFGSLTENAPIPSQGQSISRIPNGQDTDIDSNDFQIVPTTKGDENILPPPITYSDKVFINELLPEPATGSVDEFIELYNPDTAPFTFTDAGWQLDDIAGGSSPYTIPEGTTIPASGYLAFYHSATGISLNDTGDSARLLDPNGDLKDTIIYDKAIRGQSYSKFEDGWHWSTTLTPGLTNLLTIETVIPDTDPVIPTETIAVAKTLADETAVIVSGTVSVAPNTLSAQYFYIEDDSGGLQIYNYDKAFPALKPGDIIQVTGSMATYYNERRLKTDLISDIVITGSRPPPEPLETTINDLNPDLTGRYIEVTGTVSKTSGDTFYIHGSGELKVIIRSSTGIDKPRMAVGDRVEIAGIYSLSGSDYRILPTVQDDVKIIGRGGGLPDAGSDLLIPAILALILTILYLVIPGLTRNLYNNFLDPRLIGDDTKDGKNFKQSRRDRTTG